MRVQGSGFMVWGAREQGLECKGSGIRVEGLGLWGWDVGCRV